MKSIPKIKKMFVNNNNDDGNEWYKVVQEDKIFTQNGPIKVMMIIFLK